MHGPPTSDVKMDRLTLSQISNWSGGNLLGDGGASVLRVITDSRQVQAGDLFVALAGDRFDAHEFLGDVASRGAVAALVEEGRGERPRGLAVVEVDDTLAGLQRIAGAYRQALPADIVGITGSNGKTSTKDFTFAILSKAGSSWCTHGNLNNHIGVPLTLLSGNSEHRYAVVEMGMNHAGEIAPLARMARPKVGIITNIGVAHIEHLGSREAIADEKGSLAMAVPDYGTVVLNAEDDFTPRIESLTGAAVLRAGIGCGDVQAVDLFHSESGTRFALVHEGDRVEVRLGVPGKHMVRNAALSAAAAISLGIPLATIAEGLGEIRLTRGRLESREVAGIRFLDDSYNANPDSMEAALATLASLPVEGLRVAVLGRMGELGGHAEDGHRRVGAASVFHCVDWLLTVGSEAKWIADEAVKRGGRRVEHFESAQDAAAALRKEVNSEDLVLVKGSRSAHMERVITEVEAL